MELEDLLPESESKIDQIDPKLFSLIDLELNRMKNKLINLEIYQNNLYVAIGLSLLKIESPFKEKSMYIYINQLNQKDKQN